MGIGRIKTDGTKAAFSKDVLQIEIRGPKQEHLSIIDLPGLFSVAIKRETTKRDIALVRDMAKQYMKNKRSIILAVVPANTDISTQEIVQIAEDLDPEGERTLGIFTKPDIVDQGAEQTIVNVVAGRSHILKHGWCVVKNPSQRELLDPESDRHECEKNFFDSKEPWTSLPKDRVGIAALKTRMQRLLGHIIHREFSQVCWLDLVAVHTAVRSDCIVGAERTYDENQRN